ncbi:MAG: co-chaperone GroES family protein [Nitrososphaerales archaeon]
MSNSSGLFPAGRAILIRPYTPERKKSLIELPEEVQNRANTLEQRAIVVAIGPTAWHDEPQPRAKIGDKVLVGAFEGFMAEGPLDGKKYRFINDRAIFAIITDNEGTEV